MNGKRFFQFALFLLIAALFVQPVAASIIDDMFGMIGGSVQSITGFAALFFQDGNSCIDSDIDSGFFSYIANAGTCTYNGQTYNDYCNGNYVKEYKCMTWVDMVYGCHPVSENCTTYGFAGCGNGACTNNLGQTCSELGGVICSDSQTCDGNVLDASDSDSCCSGSCVTPTPSCSAQGGIICSADENCLGYWLSASDSQRCCSGSCDTNQAENYPDSCSDTDGGYVQSVFGVASGYYNNQAYSNEDYCIDGNTITENFCAGNRKRTLTESCGTDGYTGFNYCYNGDVYMDYNQYSCSGGACSMDINPMLQEDCVYGCSNGECNTVGPGQSCSELGGIVCIDGYSCGGNVANSSDADSCCMGSCVFVPQPKTCSELGGNVCGLNQVCSGNLLNASDSLACCDANCAALSPTCSAQGGNVCALDENCTASWLDASDSSRCCSWACDDTNSSGNSCSYLGGSICGSNQTCDGNLFVAPDTDSCCNGSCVSSEPCIDSDSGREFKKEISKKGRCSQGTTVLEDYCSSSTYIMEAHCGGNGCGYVSYSCKDFGFKACVNGKCVKGNGDDDCDGNDGRGDDCDGNDNDRDGRKDRKKRITADSNESVETTVSSPTGVKDIVVSSIGGKVKIISGGIEVETMRDVEVDGNYVVVGSTKLNVLPEQASEKAKLVTSNLNIKRVEIKEQSGKIVYSVNGVRSGNFLFIIPMDVEVNTTIDANTGAISTEESWWGWFVN